MRDSDFAARLSKVERRSSRCKPRKTLIKQSSTGTPITSSTRGTAQEETGGEGDRSDFIYLYLSQWTYAYAFLPIFPPSSRSVCTAWCTYDPIRRRTRCVLPVTHPSTGRGERERGGEGARPGCVFSSKGRSNRLARKEKHA